MSTAETLYSTVQHSVRQFQHWLDRSGLYTHDPYDLWSTNYGIRAKKLFHTNALLGALAVTPIFLADIVAPAFIRLRLPKRRYPIAEAHIILALCERSGHENNPALLDKAEDIANTLLESSLHERYSGHCWGYPFRWMSKNGLWTNDTPFITSTPYAFEAFLALYDATQKARYAKIAQSIAQFVLRDIHDTPTSDYSSAASYSPIDRTKVINASAYRAMVLIEAASRFGSRTMLETALRNLNFVIESQQADGSWWYAEGEASDNFVDNFHTCLVLKNLVKINRRLGFAEVWDTIERGYRYYTENLIDAHGRPKPFAKSGRIALVSREVYDYAEGISLGLLLHDAYPRLRGEQSNQHLRNQALLTATSLSKQLIESYQCADGHFVSKEHFGLLRNTVPYLRWAQSQCYYALSMFEGRCHSTSYAGAVSVEMPLIEN